MNVNGEHPARGWRELEAVEADGTFDVIRRATPRAWAELFQFEPRFAEDLREIARWLEEAA